MSCHLAASKSWDLFRIDLETAFLQGRSKDVNRDVVRQLPPEAGHPPYIAARLQKPAYGLRPFAHVLQYFEKHERPFVLLVTLRPLAHADQYFAKPVPHHEVT